MNRMLIELLKTNNDTRTLKFCGGFRLVYGRYDAEHDPSGAHEPLEIFRIEYDSPVGKSQLSRNLSNKSMDGLKAEIRDAMSDILDDCKRRLLAQYDADEV